jgi:hypothetical protein
MPKRRLLVGDALGGVEPEGRIVYLTGVVAALPNLPDRKGEAV